MTAFIRKNRGAVSIFLLIILLPTLTMTGVFVDLARTKLAQEVVTSSADLALNTVMTDYDKQLKDYYGLLASCQNTNEIIEVSKQYFADCLKSAGFTTSEVEYLVDSVTSFMGDEDISDMLRISVEGTVDISRTANGAMDNPALIKEGISEFMKYRSPINGAADLFSKITESDVAEKLKDSTAETKMIEAREAFYTAEKDLIKQAEKAYKAIKAYEDYTAHTGDKVSTEAYLEKLANFLMDPLKNGTGIPEHAVNELESYIDDNFEAIYKDAHKKMTMNLYNTHSTGQGLPSTLIGRITINEQPASTTYSESNQASSTKLENLINDLSDAIQSYCSAKESLETAWNNTGNQANGDYDIQYWVKLTNNCSSQYSKYQTAAQNVWKAANALENAVDNAKEKAMDGTMKRPSNTYVTIPQGDTNGKVAMSAVKDVLWEYYINNISYEVQNGGCSAFKSISSQISTLDNVYDIHTRLGVSTLDHIYNIRNDLEKFVMDAEETARLLDTAATETNKLSDKIDTYKQAFDKWKTAAYDESLNGNALAESENGDRKQIEDLENNGGMIDLSKDSVTELVTRLKNIKTLYDTLAKDMRNIQYNGTSILDVYDFKSFRTASKLDASKIPVNKSNLEAYAESTFSFSIGEQIQNVVIMSAGKTSTSLTDGNCYMITDSFYPSLTRTSLSLYEWLKYEFGNGSAGGKILDESTYGFDVSDEGSAEEASDKMSGLSDSEAERVDTTESTSGNNFSDWTGATLPSGGAYQDAEKSVMAKLSEAGSYAAELFSNFGETFGNSLENIRDDLFAVDYIFSMFTYDTFDNEGYFSKVAEDSQSKVTAFNTTQYYTDTVKSAWTSSDEIKTLTLNTRSKELDWCYGGEVEYILYGNPNNQKNKTTAYANIYLIRYALDLAPVFQFYWGDRVLETVALSIEAFAHIPAEFTKTVACLVITAAEAGMDIAYLKQGIPVLLYKTDDEDIFCDYASVFTGGKNNSPAQDGVTLQYSDYLKMFLFIKLTTDENPVYLRTADVIQANMSLVTKKSDYALSKAQVFFTMSGTVTIEPMWSRLLAIDDLGDLTTSTGWRSIEFTITRGY